MNGVTQGQMGYGELKAVWSLLDSNFGLIFSIIVCMFGLYQILVKGNTGLGLTLLVLSMFIPFFSNVITGVQGAFCPIIQALGGACTNFAQTQ